MCKETGKFFTHFTMERKLLLLLGNQLHTRGNLRVGVKRFMDWLNTGSGSNSFPHYRKAAVSVESFMGDGESLGT